MMTCYSLINSILIFDIFQAKNVRIIAVGIGKEVFEEELGKIAGERVYLADDFDDLSNLYAILMEEICSTL